MTIISPHHMGGLPLAELRMLRAEVALIRHLTANEEIPNDSHVNY